jgi:hypothetical protein
MMKANPQKPLPVDPQPLIPAQAGIQELQVIVALGSRFRGNERVRSDPASLLSCGLFITSLLVAGSPRRDARNTGVRKHAVLWTAMLGHDGEVSHMLSSGNGPDFPENRTLTAP